MQPVLTPALSPAPTTQGTLGSTSERRTNSPVIRAVLLNDTSHILHPGSRLVSRHIGRIFREAGVEIVHTTPYARLLSNADVRAIEACEPDLVLIHGEGGIHSSSVRPWVPRLLQVGLNVAKRRGAPVHLFNTVVDALGPAELAMLERFDGLFVREGMSRDYLASHGISARVVADLSLLEVVEEAGSRRGVIVFDSVVKEARRALKRYARQTRSTYMRMHPPFHRGPLSRLERIGLLRRAVRPLSRPERFLQAIQRAELVVSGRFHGVMFCLAARVPFVAVESNTHKISSSLTDALGSARRVLSPAQLSRGPLNVRDWMFSDQEASAVDRYLASVQAGAQNMIAHIRESVGVVG